MLYNDWRCRCWCWQWLLSMLMLTMIDVDWTWYNVEIYLYCDQFDFDSIWLIFSISSSDIVDYLIWFLIDIYCCCMMRIDAALSWLRIMKCWDLHIYNVGIYLSTRAAIDLILILLFYYQLLLLILLRLLVDMCCCMMRIDAALWDYRDCALWNVVIYIWLKSTYLFVLRSIILINPDSFVLLIQLLLLILLRLLICAAIAWCALILDTVCWFCWRRMGKCWNLHIYHVEIYIFIRAAIDNLD